MVMPRNNNVVVNFVRFFPVNSASPFIAAPSQNWKKLPVPPPPPALNHCFLFNPHKVDKL